MLKRFIEIVSYKAVIAMAGPAGIERDYAELVSAKGPIKKRASRHRGIAVSWIRVFVETRSIVRKFDVRSADCAEVALRC